VSLITKENIQIKAKVKDLEQRPDSNQVREKHIEIQKLLESNIVTLENRVELLEMQNEQLRKDKIDADDKVKEI
jgi:hypothetical protein